MEESQDPNWGFSAQEKESQRYNLGTEHWESYFEQFL
jgi:hypothetical protein